jgi:hypothetical protein
MMAGSRSQMTQAYPGQARQQARIKSARAAQINFSLIGVGCDIEAGRIREDETRGHQRGATFTYS